MNQMSSTAEAFMTQMSSTAERIIQQATNNQVSLSTRHTTLQAQVNAAELEVGRLKNLIVEEEETSKESEALLLPALSDLNLTINELHDIRRKLEQPLHLCHPNTSAPLTQYLMTESELTTDLEELPIQAIQEMKNSMVKAWTDRIAADASLVHARTLQKLGKRRRAEKNDAAHGATSSSTIELEAERASLMVRVQDLNSTALASLHLLLSSSRASGRGDREERGASREEMEASAFNQDMISLLHRTPSSSSAVREQAVVEETDATRRRRAREEHELCHQLLHEQNERLSLVEYELEREITRYEEWVTKSVNVIARWYEKIKKRAVGIQWERGEHQNDLGRRGCRGKVKKKKKTKTKKEEISLNGVRTGSDSGNGGDKSLSLIDILVGKTGELNLDLNLLGEKSAGRVTRDHSSSSSSSSSVKRVEELKTLTEVARARLNDLTTKMNKKISMIFREHEELLHDGLRYCVPAGEVQSVELPRTTDAACLQTMRLLLARKEEMDIEFQQLYELRPSYSLTRKYSP